MHTFDIDIPNKFKSKESDVIEPGKKLTCINTRFGKFGFGICYDIRFTLLGMSLRQMGAEIIFYPSVFALITGEKYFKNLGITRSLDT